jgi:hypothetical protein
VVPTQEEAGVGEWGRRGAGAWPGLVLGTSPVSSPVLWGSEAVYPGLQGLGAERARRSAEHGLRSLAGPRALSLQSCTRETVPERVSVGCSRPSTHAHGRPRVRLSVRGMFCCVPTS